MTDAKTPPKSPSKSPPGSGPASPPGQDSAMGPSGLLPAEHWAQLELVQDDAESTADEANVSSTASVSSSILNYRTLHGRRYHSEIGNAAYWGSNDERQNEALDLSHHAMTIACEDRLFLAPLEKDKIQRVLDVGTGTGVWAIDFADEFPEAEVIGTDISPIQPTWIPPNLKFEIEDCTRPWTFAASSFDYIHLRWLIGSIIDWDELFAQAYAACRPGGWVESFEPSPILESDHVQIPEDSALHQWGKFCVEAGKILGRTFTVMNDNLQRKGMEAAGFVDLQEFEFKAPFGPWPKDPRLKELGAIAQLAFDSDIEGRIQIIASTVGWTRDEIQGYISHVRNELRSMKYLPYHRTKVVWGRKPEDAE